MQALPATLLNKCKKGEVSKEKLLMDLAFIHGDKLCRTNQKLQHGVYLCEVSVN